VVDKVLIVDFETTGLDTQTATVIELGCVLWSVKHRQIVESYSTVLGAEKNEAVVFNGLSDEFLREQIGLGADEIGWSIADDAARRSDFIVAHFAKFDWECVLRVMENDVGAAPHGLELLQKTWVCTSEDVEWPKVSGKRSLAAIALAHGVAVTNAHRAIHDCLLLARLFEQVPDIDERLEAALLRAQRPKATFFANVPVEQNDLVKQAGFKWNGAVWERHMALEDAAVLPFEVVNQQELSP
jgi:DNA polymerase III subunit epsilon